MSSDPNEAAIYPVLAQDLNSPCEGNTQAEQHIYVYVGFHAEPYMYVCMSVCTYVLLIASYVRIRLYVSEA